MHVSSKNLQEMTLRKAQNSQDVDGSNAKSLKN